MASTRERPVPYNNLMQSDAVLDADVWSVRVRDALSRYSEPLLRLVASKLIKPRTTQPVEDLIDKSVAALGNPPVIDRRIRDLPPASRKLLAIVGLSRQPGWRVGHLLTLSAALGHAEGFTPIAAMFEAGLLFPELPEGTSIDDFTFWFGQVGTSAAVAFAMPSVAARARNESLELPDISEKDSTNHKSPGSRLADGLDWPLRLAALWQQVNAGPVRITQSQTIFKRDLTRLEEDEVINAPATDRLAALPDQAAMCLFWALAADLLQETEGELRAETFPPAWDANLAGVLADLVAALTHIDAWDPLRGSIPESETQPTVPTAGMLAMLLLASSPAGAWVRLAAVAGWLWEHHPFWAGTIPAEHHEDQGVAWVEALLLGVLQPLQIVEGTDGGLVRLSPLGRHLLAAGPEVPPSPSFPQTLLVQPNAEVLAYRQGLTPALISRLTRFARWKGVGPACTLELNAEQTYRGLESGLTLAQVVQTLNQHGMKPVPSNVADLLQRWANKRERVTAFALAALVEFTTPADLDTALSRGIVSLKLTDRIGMTADGKEPAYTSLRLIGNRDYESKPLKCITVADDGVTLTVDTAQADLLLEAEIGKLADPVTGDPPGLRRYRIGVDSLRRASAQGFGLADLDGWFIERAGQPLSPAGRLFLLVSTSATAAMRLVVEVPSEEIADGLMQWPTTNALVEARLGPTALAVSREAFEKLREVLAELGVRVEGELQAP